MKKNKKSRVLSLFIAFTVMISSIMVWPSSDKEVQANAGSGYTEKTFSDFDMQNGQHC